MVIKSPKELAATVRRVAREQPGYRPGTVSDLLQAATVLEGLADKAIDPAIPLNILEDSP